MRWIGICVFVFCILMAGGGKSTADAWPVRPVKIVVAYPAGTTNDAVARALAQKLSEIFGQSFYVENRTGGTGNIGTDYAAKAAPDGYTLLLGSDIQFAIGPNLDSHLPFSAKDFAPIGLVAEWHLVLSAYRPFAANDLTQLIVLAKQQPGKISYGSAGTGSPHELVMEQLQQLGGFKLTEIPYRGSGEALPDLLSGRIQLMMMGVPPTLSYLRSGQIKALAVGARERIADLPDVPTFAEQGFGDLEATTYAFVCVPAGTPEQIVARLKRETMDAVNSPEFRARLQASDIIPISSTAEELSARIEKDTAKWAGVLHGMQPR
jgi:tripartite-type tricarboxylate transporter receptor subunit TctC